MMMFSPQSSIESAFSGFSWFIFLLIIQASTIISMEFYHGTIKIFSIANIQEQILLSVKLLH